MRFFGSSGGCIFLFEGAYDERNSSLTPQANPNGLARRRAKSKRELRKNEDIRALLRSLGPEYAQYEEEFSSLANLKHLKFMCESGDLNMIIENENHARAIAARAQVKRPTWTPRHFSSHSHARISMGG